MSTTYTLFDSPSEHTKLPDEQILDLILLYEANVSLVELALYFNIPEDEVEDFLFRDLGASSWQAMSTANYWLRTLRLGPEDSEDATHVLVCARANLETARKAGISYMQAVLARAIVHELAATDESFEPEDMGAETWVEVNQSLDYFHQYVTIVESWFSRPQMQTTANAERVT